MTRQRLQDHVEIVMGQSPDGRTTNAIGSGLPLLNGPTEFGRHHPVPTQYTTDPKRIAYPGDLLFCVRGSTTGRMNWADRDYAIGRGIAAIRHRTVGETQPFVRAAIELGLPALLRQATGSTFPNVSRGQIGDLPWPDLDQKRVADAASLLGVIDRLIEANAALSESARELAQALLKAAANDVPLVPLGDFVTLSRLMVDPGQLGEAKVWLYSIPAMDQQGLPAEVLASSILSGKLDIPQRCVLTSRINPHIPRTWYVSHDGSMRALGSGEFGVLVARNGIDDEAVFAACSDPEFFRRLAAKVTGTSTSHQRVRPEDLRGTLVLDLKALSYEGRAALRDAVTYRHSLLLTNRGLSELRGVLIPELLAGRGDHVLDRETKSADLVTAR